MHSANPRPSRIRKLALLVALIVPLLGHQLNAQAVPTATGPGGYVVAGATGSLFESNYGQYAVGGIGAYVDINPHRDYGIELEYKSFRYNQQAGIRQTTLLGGPRISHGSRPLVPYVKFMVGQGTFDFPYGYAQGKYLVLAPGAGIDYSVNRRIRIRLIQAEYQVWHQFTFGSYHPYGISSGISFQFLTGR